MSTASHPAAHDLPAGTHALCTCSHAALVEVLGLSPSSRRLWRRSHPEACHEGPSAYPAQDDSMADLISRLHQLRTPQP